MKSLVAVIVSHLQMKMLSVEVIAAIKKKVQFVGNGVININTDNYEKLKQNRLMSGLKKPMIMLSNMDGMKKKSLMRIG